MTEQPFTKRAVPEWIGATPNTPIPKAVKLRLLWMRWCGDLRACKACGAPYHKTRDAADWDPEKDRPSLAGGLCADCGGD